MLPACAARGQSCPQSHRVERQDHQRRVRTNLPDIVRRNCPTAENGRKIGVRKMKGTRTERQTDSPRRVEKLGEKPCSAATAHHARACGRPHHRSGKGNRHPHSRRAPSAERRAPSAYYGIEEIAFRDGEKSRQFSALQRENARLRRGLAGLQTHPAAIPPGIAAVIPVASPVLRRSTPVVDGRIPVLRHFIPVLAGALPVLRRSIPVRDGGIPVLRRSRPVLDGGIPVMRRSIPVLAGKIPVLRRLIPERCFVIPSPTGNNTSRVPCLFHTGRISFH